MSEDIVSILLLIVLAAIFLVFAYYLFVSDYWKNKVHAETPQAIPDPYTSYYFFKILLVYGVPVAIIVIALLLA